MSSSDNRKPGVIEASRCSTVGMCRQSGSCALTRTAATISTVIWQRQRPICCCCKPFRRCRRRRRRRRRSNPDKTEQARAYSGV